MHGATIKKETMCSMEERNEQIFEGCKRSKKGKKISTTDTGTAMLTSTSSELLPHQAQLRRCKQKC